MEHVCPAVQPCLVTVLDRVRCGQGTQRPSRRNWRASEGVQGQDPGATPASRIGELGTSIIFSITDVTPEENRCRMAESARSA